jgi:MYXO-CTERM domain-containing protein
MLGLRALVLVITALVLSLGCSSSSSSSGGGDARTHPPAQGGALATGRAPFDIATVIRNVRYAYRVERGRFVANAPTYSVEVERGRVAIGFGSARPGRGEVAPRIVIATSSVARGVEPMSISSGATRIVEDGGLRIPRGDLEEELRNGPGGVEQAWRFAAPPRGAGDLEVRVAVDGLGFAGVTAGGLHFAGTHGRGFVYGHATWIDASGVKTPVPAVWDSGSIVLRVPSEVIDRAAYPARLDPIIGPETAIDDPVQSPLGADQRSPAVAFDGAQYLVAWADDVIRAARVSAAGVVLDPSGIVIHPVDPLSSGSLLGVASNGSGFLITWSDTHVGDSVVRAARVDAGGSVLDSPALTLQQSASGDALGQGVAAIAGADYLVVYRDANHILGKRVSPAGQILDAAPIQISDPLVSDFRQLPSIVAGGSEFVVVWEEDSRVVGNVVSPQGVVASAQPFPVSSASLVGRYPRVAYGAGVYLVVWEREIASNAQAVHGTILDAMHSVTTQVVIAPAGRRPDVAANGAAFSVVYDHETDLQLNPFSYQLFGVTVTADGAASPPLDAPLTGVVKGGLHTAAIAGAGGECFLAYTEGIFPSHLRATRLDASWTALDPNGIALGSAANGELDPAVASDGNGYLVVWADQRNGGDADVYGALVTAQGTVTTPSGIAIGTGPENASTPAVASNGNAYMVTWSDGYSDPVYGAVLSNTGAVVKAPFAVWGSGHSARVASNGQTFLVVWNYDGDVRHKLFDAAGNELTLAYFLFPGDTAYDPQVASNGTNYLVAWSTAFSPQELRAARVGANGVALDVAPLELGDAMSGDAEPVVGSNGSDYLVAWSNFAASSVHATVITGAGGVANPGGQLLWSGGYPSGMAIASDGTGYILPWRLGTTELRATYVAAAGHALGPPVVVEADGDWCGIPAIASSGPGEWLLVHSEFVFDPGYGAYRVHGRVVSGEVEGLALAQPCSNTAECDSGFCVDGVCCDTACGGSSPDDCQACSVSAGATEDGACGLVTAGQTCRPASAACDIPETCDGSSTVCPADAQAPDGTECDDEDTCTSDDQCSDGACAAGAPVTCTPPTPCEIGACGADGCTFTPAPDGTPCVGGVCQAGVCTPDAATSTSTSTGAGTGTATGAGAGAGGEDGGTGGGGGAGDDSGGCGCRVDAGRSTEGAAWALSLLLAFALRRRSRGTRAVGGEKVPQRRTSRPAGLGASRGSG